MSGTKLTAACVLSGLFHKPHQLRLRRLDSAHSASGFFALPWAPLEAVVQNKFVAKSDVWSFGVLLYEIWNKGQDPYESADWCV